MVKLVDRVLEIIHRSLEECKYRSPQTKLALVKLFGELYNYAVVSNAVIFEALYHYLNYGHEVGR